MSYAIKLEPKTRVQLNVDLDPELRREVATLAIESKRPLRAVVKEALTEHVARCKAAGAA